MNQVFMVKVVKGTARENQGLLNELRKDAGREFQQFLFGDTPLPISFDIPSSDLDLDLDLWPTHGTDGATAKALT